MTCASRSIRIGWLRRDGWFGWQCSTSRVRSGCCGGSFNQSVWEALLTRRTAEADFLDPEVLTFMWHLRILCYSVRLGTSCHWKHILSAGRKKVSGENRGKFGQNLAHLFDLPTPVLLLFSSRRRVSPKFPRIPKVNANLCYLSQDACLFSEVVVMMFCAEFVGLEVQPCPLLRAAHCGLHGR